MEHVNVLLTSLLSVAALFVMAKLMGRRQIAELGVFDYITGITIGSIAAELAVTPEQPLRYLIAMVIYVLASVLLNTLADKSPKARGVINGRPSVLMSGGRIYKRNLKKAKLDLGEFLSMCRLLGYFDLSQISAAVFECNGRLSILPRSACRTVTPEDLSLAPPGEELFTEAVMDGKIMLSDLRRRGLDERWLLSELKNQGYPGPERVFLALVDSKNNLAVYPVGD